MGGVAAQFSNGNASLAVRMRAANCFPSYHLKTLTEVKWLGRRGPDNYCRRAVARECQGGTEG